MAGAVLALLVSSAAVLGLGQGLRRLVDEGFKSGDVATLDRAVLLLIGVVVLLAGSTFCRFYLVSWIGERVVADIRRAVFDRVIALSPAYFEVHRTGDILSRLTTDTTVLQTVIGSTVSQALRNALLLVGGLAMLAVTSVLNQKFLFTLGLNHDGAAAKPFDGGQDVVGGFGPAEGLGVGIAGVDVGGDGGLQRGG